MIIPLRVSHPLKSNHYSNCSLTSFHFITVTTQTSSFIDYIITDLLRGRAVVYLKDGNRYAYNNVSRRAILNLQLQPNMSLGFWFNHNILDSVRVNAERSYLMSF